ncbi:MAG: hypothetical protein ChlgKO_13540 [Chlamydiales bacterium]
MNTENIKQTLLQWKDTALSIDLSKFKPTDKKTALIASAIFTAIIAIPTIAYFALRNRTVTISEPTLIAKGNSLDKYIFGKFTKQLFALGLPLPDSLPKFEGDDIREVTDPFTIVYDTEDKEAIMVKNGDKATFLSIKDKKLVHIRVDKSGKLSYKELTDEEGKILEPAFFNKLKEYIKNLSELSR